jgi:type I restriction enzyme S subunit
MRLTVSKKYLEPKFLYYFFRSSIGQYELLKNSSQVGVPAIASPTKALKDVEITLPPLPTQRRIADILSALDEKIELNRQTNASLEAIAQAVFKEWFVDFNFPGATGKLVESELGLIPSGWRVGELGEIYKTTSGGTPSRTRMDYYENGIHQWVKSKELNSSFIIDTEEKITDEGLKNSSAKILPRHSVLIAMYGATVGQVGIVSNKASTNQAICAFIPNDNYPFSFIYQFLMNNKDEIISRAVGSAQQNISQELLKNIEIVIPDKSVLREYHIIVEPIFFAIEENIQESATLAALRDHLLPKLMSGDIEL